MCPGHFYLSILIKPKVQTRIVKLCVLLEDCMGRMTTGTKHVPQPHGKLMQIKEKRTLCIDILKNNDTKCAAQCPMVMQG